MRTIYFAAIAAALSLAACSETRKTKQPPPLIVPGRQLLSAASDTAANADAAADSAAAATSEAAANVDAAADTAARKTDAAADAAARTE